VRVNTSGPVLFKHSLGQEKQQKGKVIDNRPLGSLSEEKSFDKIYLKFIIRDRPHAGAG